MAPPVPRQCAGRGARTITATLLNLNPTQADLAVRIKTSRGRGGGVEDVLFENITGSSSAGVPLTLQYTPGLQPTNSSATPVRAVAWLE